MLIILHVICPVLPNSPVRTGAGVGASGRYAGGPVLAGAGRAGAHYHAPAPAPGSHGALAGDGAGARHAARRTHAGAGVAGRAEAAHDGRGLHARRHEAAAAVVDVARAQVAAVRAVPAVTRRTRAAVPRPARVGAGRARRQAAAAVMNLVNSTT